MHVVMSNILRIYMSDWATLMHETFSDNDVY